MLRILQKQMRAFGLLAAQDFAEEMIEHLLDFAPDDAKSLGPEALRQIVDMGSSEPRVTGSASTVRCGSSSS